MICKPKTGTKTNENCTNQLSPALIAAKLLQYCQNHNWAGYDPYDGLNSRIFQSLRCLHFKYPRLVLIQLLKRSPVNFRPLLLIPPEQNPKGIALFLSAVVKLYRLGLIPDDGIMRSLAERLIELCSSKDYFSCWGYNFDWQTRTVMVPRGSPNIICTTFAGNSLLEVYALDPKPYILDMAVSAAKYLRDYLYWEPNDSEACYSYYPHDRTLIHNANLLGAAFMCRVARQIRDESMVIPALKAARFSASRQHGDGSWDYGECDRPTQRWVDNFHTGFNLCALHCIGHEAETSEFEPHLVRGFKFYRQHFFNKDGAPKYYHDRLYPIDIHSAAQSIITLVTLGDLDGDSLWMANRVMAWTLSNMWSNRGFFYYQRRPYWTIKIPYMRWSQAWMLLALGTLLERCNQEHVPSIEIGSVHHVTARVQTITG